MRRDPVNHDFSPPDSHLATLLVDGATGLPSRLAWDEILRVEESRRRRYGSTAGMILVELPTGAGLDVFLNVAGEVLTLAVRETDPVARVGDRHLGVLAVPCDGGLDVLAHRLRRQLTAEKIDAVVMPKIAAPAEDLTTAWTALEQSASRPLRLVAAD